MQIRLAILLLVSLLSACRFVVPDGQEKEELVRRGAFPNGVPAWYGPQTRIDNKPVAQRDSGVATERLFVPQAAQNAHPRLDYVRANMNQFEEEAVEQQEAPKKTGPDLSGLSPLERVEAVCPGMEDDVRQALLTEDRAVRVLKYESLSNRCQESTDIWLWLAKDYRQMGDYSRAESALNRLLELDPENSEAQSLLREVRNAAVRGGV